MARAAELFQPKWILIENVPGVVHDRGGVVEWTRAALVRLGYRVDAGVVDVSRIGVAQRRRRFVIAASRVAQPSVERAASACEVGPRSLRWAIGDLGSAMSETTYDSSARHSATNRRRIETLFQLGVFDLPDQYRPDCHRLKKHSYKSVYGRLHWDDPAPTITAGFGSTGQGRFVHPEEPRTLTPHEAARVQFIPDYFRFPDVGRVALQEMIGNAVPPKLAYALALELMR
jgi:DNA (cytosine-5)-methyltransferase 1